MRTKHPAPTTRDAELISQIYSQVNQGEVYDAWHDVEIASLVSNYQAATKSRDHFDEMATKFKAQIIERVKTAEKVVGDFGTINMSRTKDSAGKLITEDMVGTVVGARAGYRQFKFTPAKKD